MAKKIRVWDGSAWQDVSVALPYNAVHSAQASMPSTAVDGQIWLDTDGTLSDTQYIPKTLTSTTGDIIYASSANTPARLGIGTSGQLLGVSGGVPAWSTPTAPSNFSLLGSASLSGSTTTVSGISGMNQIYVLINSASITSGGELLRLRINTDTGSNYDELFGYVIGNSSWASSNVGGNANLSNTYFLMTVASNTGAGLYFGGAMINGCNTTGNKMVQWTGGATAAGGLGQYALSGIGRYTGTSTVSSVSLNTSGGTFDAGTMYVYGSA